MSPPKHEVIIAGAGPVGLWLAAELKLAGVDVVVLEKEPERVPHSKALAVYRTHARALRTARPRRAVARCGYAGVVVSFRAAAHPADFSYLDSRYLFTLFFPQLRTEELLEEHAPTRGPVREHSVTSASQDDEGVTVTVATRRGPAAFALSMWSA